MDRTPKEADISRFTPSVLGKSVGICGEYIARQSTQTSRGFHTLSSEGSLLVYILILGPSQLMSMFSG